MPYGDKDLGQHWLRWWLVAWQHQCITWTNIDFLKPRFCGIHLIATSSHLPKVLFHKLSFKICFKFTTTSPRDQWVNSLAPGRSKCNSKNVIFNLVLLIGIFRSSYDNALRWMPQDLTDDKSTLDQVMAWCHQATSHYLSQCWPRFLSPYGVTRPQWVNTSHKLWGLQ